MNTRFSINILEKPNFLSCHLKSQRKYETAMIAEQDY